MATRFCLSPILGLTFCLTLWSATALAESCFRSDLRTELFDAMTYCASSVLPSQGAGNYGPGNLSHDGKGSGAWCEGVAGTGVGEWFSVRVEPRKRIRSIVIENGYQKSDKAFYTNARLKRVVVSTDAGDKVVAVLSDRRGAQPVRLPRWTDVNTVKVTILSVYPGEKYGDTCVSGFYADLEEWRTEEYRRQGIR